MNRYSKALRILNPKGQVEDKSFLAVKIVKDEYYSRPVMEKEIQEYIQKTFKKSNQYRYRKGNWLENLVEEKQTEFDRKEIEKEIKLRRLYEQMTTKDMMTIQIPGEGETDLDSLDGSVAASYSPLSGEESAFSNTAITASGTGSGSDGGFNLGQDYLAFNGGSEYQVRYAALDPIDSTEIDTMVITAVRGNDTNGGEDPDAEDEDLNVWYQIGDGAPTKIGIIIPVGSDDGTLKNWSIGIPKDARSTATKFILRQETHHGVGFDNYGVTDIKFQRRSPMSVFVSLDSPEAVSFIRTGGDEEKDRKKKVQDILDGSDAYLENRFGSDFPGTSPREVGQEEPQPGIGQFEPEVIDYETWKNELEKSDDPEVKKILKGDPKKTFDKFVDDNPELAAQSVLNDILNGKSVENQLSQLPQEVQDIIISKTVESVLSGEVNVELSQLPQEVQDVLITNPEYMTNERIDNLINDKKLVGDILSSMWEKDQTLFDSLVTEVGELPYHQQVNELKNNLSGTKYKGDEGFVDYGDESNQVLSNMSQLDQNRYGPVLELQQSFYGIRDSDAPSDYRFNYASGREIVKKTGELITPSSAEGSPYHEMMDKIKEANEKRQSYFNSKDGPGENALESREDYKEYENAMQSFLDYHNKIGGVLTKKDGKSVYQISIPTFKGSDWLKGRAEWRSLKNKADQLWSSSYKAWKKDSSVAAEDVAKLRKEKDAMREEHRKKVAALEARLDAEYNRNKTKIEKAVEDSVDIFAQDFMKMFIMQYSGNMSSNYSFGASDLPDILPSTTADDSKPSSEPWSMDIQVGDERIIKKGQGQSSTTILDTQKGIGNNKQLSGSVGKTAGVDAATAASVAAQTQRDKDKKKKGDTLIAGRRTGSYSDKPSSAEIDAKNMKYDPHMKMWVPNIPKAQQNNKGDTQIADKGNKGGNISGSNLTAAKENELLQLAKMIDRKGTNVAGVGVAAGMIAAPLAQQVTAWIAAGLSSAYIMNMIKSQSGSSSNPISDSGLMQMKDGSITAGDGSETGSKPAVIPAGETAQQAKEREEAETKLKEAEKTYGVDSPEAQAARQARTKLLGDHKGQRRAEKGTWGTQPGSLQDKQQKSDAAKEKRDARLTKNQEQSVKQDEAKLKKHKQKGGKPTVTADDLMRKKLGDLFQSYKPKGNPLMEKKKFDAVEPKEHRMPGKKIKSPQQFFNPADVKPEYPKDPPPEMINGWHPKLADGKEIANRFNKLDPQSAKAMPKTGNPHIDAKVEKAKNKPK